jgi:hypothetical protein
MTTWFENEHGLWCPSCGYHVAHAEQVEAADRESPEECRQCGFPDDGEKMARYHCDDEDYVDPDDEDDFDCGRYWIKGEGWFCPKQGSEECDWDCPHS